MYILLVVLSSIITSVRKDIRFDSVFSINAMSSAGFHCRDKQEHCSCLRVRIYVDAYLHALCSECCF